MRTFVMGDLQGAWKALEQCLERCGFQREEDVLIHLGNVVDVHKDVYECVETLLRIPKLVPIRGSHDALFRIYILTGYHPKWWIHGGMSTLKGYLRQAGKETLRGKAGIDSTTLLKPDDIPESHREFFLHQRDHYIDEANRFYVHGGGEEMQLWASTLLFEKSERASGKDVKFKLCPNFESVFIGHSSTVKWGTDQPIRAANVWNVNTGARDEGRLTIMDAETKEYWQSDPMKELYPWFLE